MLIGVRDPLRELPGVQMPRRYLSSASNIQTFRLRYFCSDQPPSLRQQLEQRKGGPNPEKSICACQRNLLLDRFCSDLRGPHENREPLVLMKQTDLPAEST